jgi:tryptophan-rich sensory protein
VGFGVELAVYAVQLVLNFCWSWLFFGRRRPDLAMYGLAAM